MSHYICQINLHSIQLLKGKTYFMFQMRAISIQLHIFFSQLNLCNRRHLHFFLSCWYPQCISLWRWWRRRFLTEKESSHSMKKEDWLSPHWPPKSKEKNLFLGTRFFTTLIASIGPPGLDGDLNEAKETRDRNKKRSHLQVWKHRERQRREKFHPNKCPVNALTLLAKIFFFFSLQRIRKCREKYAESQEMCISAVRIV